jgi:hypothetical protein
MDVSVRLEDRSRHTWAVYVDGDCIARGLPRADPARRAEGRFRLVTPVDLHPRSPQAWLQVRNLPRQLRLFR